MNKILKQNIKDAVLNPANALGFTYHMNELLDQGFLLEDENGKFDGICFEEDEKPNHIVMTHKEAGITVKIVSNQYFGTTLHLQNDKYSILEENG